MKQDRHGSIDTRFESRRALLAAALACCGLPRAARGAEIEAVAAAAANATADAQVLDAALRGDGGAATAAGAIVLSVPDLVDDGAHVPVSVSCNLPGTSEIAIVVPANPSPLAVRFTIPEGTEPFVSTRIKVAASGRIYAVVRNSGQFSSAWKETQVTVGGCG